MRILITGGTGFIGSRLALFFQAKGDCVTIVGQDNTEVESANRKLLEAKCIETILASVTDEDRMRGVVQGMDLVFHLAAAQHEANVPDQHFWDVNVTGTQNLLDASAKAHVCRFVYASTIGVYGAASSGLLHEQSPLQPDNIYGRTKLEAESRVRLMRDRLPVVIVRVAETYGPGDYRLLKLFKAIHNKVFFVIGNGKNIHHLTYIDDLINGLLLAANMDGVVGETFVLAGKEALTTDAMVATIAEQLGVACPRFHAPMLPFFTLAIALEKTMQPLGLQPPLHRRRLDFFRKSFSFSLDKASEYLGFTPQWTFKDGVAATAAWYRNMGYFT